MANGHLILGKCTGLIGTDNIATAECFHGRQFANQGFFPEQTLDADTESDGNHSG